MASYTIDKEFWVTNGSITAGRTQIDTSESAIGSDTGDKTKTHAIKIYPMPDRGIEHMWDKNTIVINLPTQFANQPRNSGTDAEPDTMMVDLMRLNEIIHIRVILVEDSNESALAKKKNKETENKRGGVFQIVWAGSDPAEAIVKQVNCSRCQIVELAGTPYVTQAKSLSTALTVDRGFEIDATFVVGRDR